MYRTSLGALFACPKIDITPNIRGLPVPFSINGFGNFYFGKQRIHSVYSRCGFCNAFDVLKSYDTSNYIIAMFVPIFPLGERRVLNHCPRCQQFNTLSLRTWEQSKRQAIEAMKVELASEDHSAEPVKKAIGIAIAYQDIQLLDSVAQTLGNVFADDAEVQTLLGEAFVYFCRNSDAAIAFLRANAVEPTDSLNDRIGLAYLKSGEPQNAEPYANNALASSNQERMWLPKLMIKAYQGKNDHASAKQWLAKINQSQPTFADTPEGQHIRAQVDHAASLGAPVEDYFLHSKGIVVSESSKRRFALVHLVAPTVVVAVISAYLGLAWYQGIDQTVYLVNGLNNEYDVTVNGELYTLQPATPKKISVKQGLINVVPSPTATPQIPPSEFPIQTSFLFRPLSMPVFVVNPDRSAILLHELTYYAANPKNAPEGKLKIRTGKPNYMFERIDFLFEPFPKEISIKGGMASRIRLAQEFVDNANIEKILTIATSPEAEVDLTEFLEQRILYFGDSDILMQFLSESSPAERIDEFIRKHLDDTPTRISVHRAYQRSQIEKGEKEKLVEEYKSRLAREPDSAPLNYLLARIVDSTEESGTLFEKAIALDGSRASIKSEFASKLLNSGKLDQAAEIAESVQVKSDTDPGIQLAVLRCLEAGNRTASIKRLSRLVRNPFSRSAALCEIRSMAQEEGYQPTADYIRRDEYRSYRTDELQNTLTDEDTATMVAALCYATQRLDQYVTFISSTPTLKAEYATEIALLTEGYRGFLDPDMATEKHGEVRWEDYAVAALIASGQNDAKSADKLTNHCITLLNQGSYEEKLLANLLTANQKQSLTEQLRGIQVTPNAKRIIGALLIESSKERDAELTEFVRLMNFERSHPYWIITAITE